MNALSVGEKQNMVIIFGLFFVLMWLLGFLSTYSLASILTALLVCSLIYFAAREIEQEESFSDAI